MSLYRVQGIPLAVATTVRETLRSPQYGHPAHAEVATGYGPCRLCLQTFRVGHEQRLLFTYQPFADSAPSRPRGRCSFTRGPASVRRHGNSGGPSARRKSEGRHQAPV